MKEYWTKWISIAPLTNLNFICSRTELQNTKLCSLTHSRLLYLLRVHVNIISITEG